MALQKNLKKLALISCRGAGGFVLRRQSLWSLIFIGVQRGLTFCLEVSNGVVGRENKKDIN